MFKMNKRGVALNEIPTVAIVLMLAAVVISIGRTSVPM